MATKGRKARKRNSAKAFRNGVERSIIRARSLGWIVDDVGIPAERYKEMVTTFGEEAANEISGVDLYVTDEVEGMHFYLNSRPPKSKYNEEGIAEFRDHIEVPGMTVMHEGRWAT